MWAGRNLHSTSLGYLQFAYSWGMLKKNNKKTPLKQQTARMEARPSPHQRPHFLKSPSPPHGAHAVTVSLNPMSLTPA